MRATILLAFFLWQAAPAKEPPVAQPEHLQYVRAIDVTQGTGQACAALDAQIFPHASPSLTDLRIFPAQSGAAAGAAAAGRPHEAPYAITLSEAMSEDTEAAKVLNLGVGQNGSAGAGAGKEIVFDLEMPDRAYTDVTLDLDPQVRDFIATAKVSGMDALGGRGKVTALGTFTLFDLSSQHLSRDTTLPLAETTFRYLHVVLAVSPAPGSAAGARFAPAMVQGAEVPPSREAQTVYTTVAETASIATAGRTSVANFIIPARVPLERVSFVLAPGFKGNFSRDVRVIAVAERVIKSGADDSAGEDDRKPLPETVTGNIMRVHATEAGHEIDTEQLSVPAILGANLQRVATVDVVVENGDDQPLPIAAVRLEMRQRKLCFDAAAAAAGAGAGLSLYYGDPKLVAPVYDYARLFVASRKPLVAALGPEQLNPGYDPAAEEVRPFTERHPELLWIVLIVVVCVLGVVALKSSRNVGR